MHADRCDSMIIGTYNKLYMVFAASETKPILTHFGMRSHGKGHQPVVLPILDQVVLSVELHHGVG